MQRPSRVLIADDRPRSRDGLRTLLGTYAELQVVGEAANGEEAMELVGQYQPDVVVMDARMPGTDGLTATRLIKERWPEVKIIVLTMYGSHRADAMASGADVFIVKGCPSDELLGAILGHQPVSARLRDGG